MSGMGATLRPSHFMQVCPLRLGGTMKPKQDTETSWSDQYKNPKWQKKRLEALEDAGWRCLACHQQDRQLHVHHIAYAPSRKIWEYELSNLTVLCDKCHRELHGRIEHTRAALTLEFLGNGPDALLWPVIERLSSMRYGALRGIYEVIRTALEYGVECRRMRPVRDQVESQ